LQFLKLRLREAPVDIYARYLQNELPALLEKKNRFQNERRCTPGVTWQSGISAAIVSLLSE
jgi:hypothetical protein